jgi:hypothetical protein
LIFSELFWFTHLSNLLKPTHVAHFSKISFVWVSQQSLHLSLLVTSMRAFASPWPDIVLLATFPLLRSLYQFTWSIYEDYPASPGIFIYISLTEDVSVILLSNWSYYESQQSPLLEELWYCKSILFQSSCWKKFTVLSCVLSLGKQISSCHSDLVTVSLPPGRVNCLISFPPLLLCHWFSNSASQCVKCSFFLQRKPFFSKMIFQKICFVFENWNSQCLFTTMFKQFWGFVLNFLVKVISDEDKWWDDLLLWFSTCSSDYLNVFWEKK